MTPGIFAKTYAIADIRQLFDTVRADGYGAVQFNLSCVGLPTLPDAPAPNVAREVAEAAAAAGVAIAALSGTCNLAHPDAAARAAMRPRLAAVIETAAAMGAPLVTLCTGSRCAEDMWRAHPDNTTPAAWTDFRRELENALDYAEAWNVTLAIEPEPGNVVADAALARRVLDEVGSPKLRIVLDAANLLSPATLARQHEVMDRAVELLGDAIVLAHAKDIATDGAVVPPAEGAVDLAHFCASLNGVGYRGALIAHGFGQENTRAAGAALNQLIADQQCTCGT